MPRLTIPDHFQFLPFLWAMLACFAGVASAENVTLRLSSGDQISGAIILRTKSHVVISNSWIAELTVPLDRIVSGLTNSVPVGAGDSTATMVFGEAKPKSDTLAETKPKHWSGEAQLGLDLMYGAKDRQLFHGRFKLAYLEPYRSDHKKFFRNVFDYSIQYGKTESRRTDENGNTRREMETTSDRMFASDKMSFDLSGRWYVYSLIGGGYDHIQKINAQYEAGPGVGYHLIVRSNLTLNVEGGLNYQGQYRSDGGDVQDVYYRLAEDVTWKLWGKLSLVEKLEFFPRVNFAGYRVRFESTLKYDLWKNISLNLTVLDLYDTKPADTVSRNELQVRSSLGVKF
jgi:hypothetical protein